MTAKQLLHAFKKDVFLNWRKHTSSKFKRFIWPQIIYTGRLETQDVSVVGVIFEINTSNQEVIIWEAAESDLAISGVPVFYIDSRNSPPRLYVGKSGLDSNSEIVIDDWPNAFNSALGREDYYQRFDQNIDSYEAFRRAANPAGTRACDLDAVEVSSGRVIGIEATEIWKVAPWKYFFMQFQNVLTRRQGSYNLDALMAQWVFIDRHVSADQKKLILVLHKLLWCGFDFDGHHTLRPKGSDGTHLQGYFKDANNSAVIDDEAVCVFFEVENQLIYELRNVQKDEGKVSSILNDRVARRSIYDIYRDVVGK